MFAKIGKRITRIHISVVLGIGICKNCYRLPQNSDHPLIHNSSWNLYKIHYPDNTVGIDLYGFILDRLSQAGIPKTNISNLQACSFHTENHEGKPLFFSHRRAITKSKENANNEGRFITFIHLSKEEKTRSINKREPLS